MQRKSILQVITLLGSGGAYGGPLRVAFELGDEFIRQGVKTAIIGGVLNSVDFPVSSRVETSGISVKPIVGSLPVSSLFGIKLPIRIFKQIKKFEIIHIHFARDLLPITAALISIILRKPYFLQTHGMIKKDNRLLVKFIDKIFVQRIFKKANAVFALQLEELSELNKLGLTARFEIVPNGIEIGNFQVSDQRSEVFTAVFCARLAPVKQIDRFMNIARCAANDNLNSKFEIYGPDGGDLLSVIDYIKSNNLGETLSYKGPVNPPDVPALLSIKSLLILPSRYDPFPVSILESLSVGTPVLVNPSCGIADILKEYNNHFVSVTDSVADLYSKFLQLYENPVNSRGRQEIIKFTAEKFSIKKVVEELLTLYDKRSEKI